MDHDVLQWASIPSQEVLIDRHDKLSEGHTEELHSMASTSVCAEVYWPYRRAVQSGLEKNLNSSLLFGHVALKFCLLLASLRLLFLRFSWQTTWASENEK